MFLSPTGFALLVCLSHQICHSTSVSLSSVASDCVSCVSCTEFVVHQISSQLPHLCTHVTTSVNYCNCLAQRRRHKTRCSVSRTLPHELSLTHGRFVGHMSSPQSSLAGCHYHVKYWLCVNVHKGLQSVAQLLASSLYAGHGGAGSSTSPLCYSCEQLHTPRFRLTTFTRFKTKLM